MDYLKEVAQLAKSWAGSDDAVADCESQYAYAAFTVWFSRKPRQLGLPARRTFVTALRSLGYTVRRSNGKRLLLAPAKPKVDCSQA